MVFKQFYLIILFEFKVMTHSSDNYYKSEQLAEDFYCYVWQGMGNNCNSCLFADVIRGERPHALVDPGHLANEMGEPCFDYLVKAIEDSGLNADDIGLVINTHSHPDHCQANEALVTKNQAVVTLSKEEDEFRATLGGGIYSMLGIKAPRFTPLFYLKEGTLDLGAKNRISLQVLLTPGHSPGSVCLYWPENKILISGDVVFYGSIGRTDFPGGSLSQLKGSIDRLAQLDVGCLVPGHSTELGSVIKGKRNVERNFQSIKLFF